MLSGSQKETYENVSYGTELTDVQKQEVMDLCQEFQHILTDIPGKITLDECGITVTDDETFRLRPLTSARMRGDCCCWFCWCDKCKYVLLLPGVC